MQEPHSNLEEKDNLNILKEYFSSRADPSIFIEMAPALLDHSNNISWVFKELLSF